MTSNTPQNPRKKEEGDSIDSATIVNWIIIPGLIGGVAAFIIGRILPFGLNAIGLGHGFATMGNNLSTFLDKEGQRLFSSPIMQNTTLWIIVFGFIFGVAVKYFYSDERAK